MRGEYGTLPAAVNEDVRKKCIGDDEVITCRPADLLSAEMDKLTEEAGDLARCEEDVLSIALFPQVAKDFLENRIKKESGVVEETVEDTIDMTAAEAAAEADDEELVAVITAAIKAYGGNEITPVITRIQGTHRGSSGAHAVNPMVRNA